MTRTTGARFGATTLAVTVIAAALAAAVPTSAAGAASAGVSVRRAGPATAGPVTVPAAGRTVSGPGAAAGTWRGNPARTGTSAPLAVAAAAPTPGVVAAAATLGRGDFTPVTPARALDTRTGNGAPAAKVGAGRTITVQLTGRAGVPATGVTAVAMAVTATRTTAAGALSVYPAGITRPGTVSLHFAAGQQVTNLVLAKVSASGQVTIFNSAGSTDVIADVHGYYGTSSTLHPLTPARLLDTRTGLGAPAARLAAGASVNVQVTGRGGVPATGATGVVVNLSGLSAATAGSMAVFPTGTAAGLGTVNLPATAPVSNLAFVQLGTGGQITVLNRAGAAHALLDVVAWQGAGGQFHPVGPERRYDTRATGATGPIASNSWLDLWITGFGSVPAIGVHAVVLNVTVLSPAANGSVVIHQQGGAKPGAATLSYTKGRTSTSQVIAFIGAGGWIRFDNVGASVNFIVDAVGWYSADGTTGLAVGQGLTLPTATYQSLLAVSPDGRYVFFIAQEALAPYAVLNSVYVRDVLLGLTQVLVSGAFFPDWVRVSADGRRLTFESTDPRLWDETRADTLDVFWYDVTTNDFQLVSTTTTGVPGNGNSSGAELSPDGRYVGFKSLATNLAAGQTAGLNTLVRDMVTGTTRRIGPCSAAPTGFSCVLAVSTDGGTVVFRTDQPDRSFRPMLWRRSTGATTLISQIEQNDEFEGMTADGGTILFRSVRVLPPAVQFRDAVLALNISSGTLTAMNDRPDGQIGEGTTRTAAMSADGSTVAFSMDSDLTVNTPQAAGPSQAYVTTGQGGPLTWVSRNAAGVPGDGDSDVSALSVTGAYLVWSSRATNLGFPAVAPAAVRLHRLK